MKKSYIAPEVEVEKFSLPNSILTSSDPTGWGSGGDNGGMGDSGAMMASEF